MSIGDCIWTDRALTGRLLNKRRNRDIGGGVGGFDQVDVIWDEEWRRKWMEVDESG
jgi:hypothetical protein